MKIEFHECCSFECCRVRLTKVSKSVRELEQVCGNRSNQERLRNDGNWTLEDQATRNFEELYRAYCSRDEEIRSHAVQCIMGIGQYKFGTNNLLRRVVNVPDCDEISVSDQVQWSRDTVGIEAMSNVRRKITKELERAEGTFEGKSMRMLVTLKRQREYKLPSASEDQGPRHW